MYWVYFVVLITVMYVVISLTGSLTGGTGNSVWQSVRQVFTWPVLSLMLVANCLYAAGIYFGFIVSANALPISISIGVVASYIYSVLMAGVTITTAHIIGIIFVLVGVYLLR